MAGKGATKGTGTIYEKDGNWHGQINVAHVAQSASEGRSPARPKPKPFEKSPLSNEKRMSAFEKQPAQRSGRGSRRGSNVGT